MFGLGVKVLQSTYVTDDSVAITLSRNRLLKYSSHVFTESAVYRLLNNGFVLCHSYSEMAVFSRN